MDLDPPELLSTTVSGKPLSPPPAELGLTVECPRTCNASALATVTLALALAAALSYVVYDMYTHKWHLYFDSEMDT